MRCQYAHATVCKVLFNQVDHQLATIAIEIGERFIQQLERNIGHHQARQCDAPLLSRRKRTQRQSF